MIFQAIVVAVLLSAGFMVGSVVGWHERGEYEECVSVCMSDDDEDLPPVSEEECERICM